MMPSPEHIKDAEFFLWFAIGSALRVWLRTNLVFQSPTNKLGSRSHYLRYNLSRLVMRFAVDTILFYWPLRHASMIASVIPQKILYWIGVVPQAWISYLGLGIAADLLLDYVFSHAASKWPGASKWLKEAVPPADGV